MKILRPERCAYRLIAAFIICIIFAANSLGQEQKLGTVDFPTSTSSQEAQRHFIRGVAALHSFWYEEAADEFRQAEAIDPNFAMAYWGEAMTYNHPLWAQQDAETARKVLAKIPDNPKVTPRERAFLEAVKILYGSGDKLSRDIAYSRAMEKIYQDYPDDVEAACFYALSLLGTVRPGDKGYRRQMKAAAIAMSVFQKNPDHPGAAHYIIHACDDPDHAILALPAARRYAEIAPAASHAQHMPSHIFLQLGMWKDAAASNEKAWATSDEWVTRKHLPITMRDYHSFQWLDYVYLQQGRYEKAAELLDTMRKVDADTNHQSTMNWYLKKMEATYIVETQKWDLADKWFPNEEAGPESGEDHMHHTAAPSGYRPGTDAMIAYVRGLAAAERGLPTAQEYAAQLDKMSESAGDAYRAEGVRIMALEVRASSSASGHDYTRAVGLMDQATGIEAEMSPPSGPPDIIKPPLELYGEILLQANRPAEAAKKFDAALEREPNRARSLIGKARALAASGQTESASDTYVHMLKIWDRADPGLTELKEIKTHVEGRM